MAYFNKKKVKRVKNLSTVLTTAALLTLGGSYLYDSADVYSYEINELTWVSDQQLSYILNTMDGNDTLNLTVSSFGGSMIRGFKIMDEMYNTKGTINIDVEGYSMSMGTLIMMSGDTLSIGPTSGLLFHLGSRGDNIMPLDDPTQQWGMKSMDLLYGKYLTLKEKLSILSGEDVIVLGADFTKRMELGGSESPTFIELADEMLEIMKGVKK